MKTGLELIAQERREQIEKHGRTLETDRTENNHYQLSQAASLMCYVDPEEVGAQYLSDEDNPDFNHCAPSDWDGTVWNRMMNKEYKDRLVIAGALIAAEIDRLQALEG